MKQTLITLIIVLAAMSGWAKKAVVWNTPSLLYSSESYFRVKSVTFADTATVVELLTVNPKYNIRFVSETFLRGDDGKRYMIRYCKEYPLNQWMPVERKPESLLTLVFEPMPARQKAIDLLEGYGSWNFKFFGIHDSAKPLKVKPFPYDDSRVDDFRKSFFTTDSVCVKGRFEEVPADRSGIIYYDDVLAHKSCPIVVTVNDDGTFERKFKVEHPVENIIYFGNTNHVPFIVSPGQTVDVTIRRNGSMEYTDGSGNPSPFANLLGAQLSTLDVYGYNSFVTDVNAMDFIEYGQKMERVADDAVRLNDYIARRYEFSPLEYAVARMLVLVRSVRWFMEYGLEKKYAPMDSITTARFNNPDNYRMLRNDIFNDSMGLMLQDFSTLQNRYSYMIPISGTRYHMLEDGSYMMNDNATTDSLVMALDRKITGREEPSVLAKVHLLNELQSRLDNRGVVIYMSVPTEEENSRSEERAKNDYRLAKSELTDSFFLVKADRIYRHYLDTRDFTYKLPYNKATSVLKKITDRFKGKYVFLDFWSTGCGPCRANIEKTEAAREELRKNPEVAFVFITSDYESPEALYNEYVSKHLSNDNTFRLPKADYELLREQFQFNGIPHYETLDKQGDVIRTKGHWFSIEDFNAKLAKIKRMLE